MCEKTTDVWSCRSTGMKVRVRFLRFPLGVSASTVLCVQQRNLQRSPRGGGGGGG